jgi:predicted RND superfamily exporter protein
MVGFFGCLSPNHPALTSVSTMALIGMGCCLLATLTLLPALLQVRERRQAAPQAAAANHPPA